MSGPAARAGAVQAALKSAFRPELVVARDGEREVRLCAGTACHASGRPAVREAFKQELASRGLTDKVRLVETGCHGFCDQGPIVVVQPQGVFYPRVEAKHVKDIVEASVIGESFVDKLLYRHPETGEPLPYEKDIPFYTLQRRLVLALNGKIDPCSIDDYLARGGYRALATALGGDPESVIGLIEESGLRGRGNAGSLSGTAWRLTRSAPGDYKYVVCNADEGDPGAFAERSLLEGNPHQVVEGMIIAAYCVGARGGYVYVGHECPLAVERLGIALRQCRERGLLGDDILGSGFSFDVRINRGASAFVCGEETALMASIEGRRGVPRVRPPFPAEEGLWGRPTDVNNVETYANVPGIVQNGAAAYAAMGMGESRGTMVFSLAGRVKNGGVIEVPMGATMRQVVFGVGGGMLPGRRFKAVQLGGPSGGCLPTELLDTRIDHEELRATGAMVGSGGLVVVDDTTCMVDLARYFLEFTQRESCGKCVPCRLGSKRSLEVLDRITQGEGREGDIELLEELSQYLMDGALCALGATALNPVLSTVRHFRDEYEAHVTEKRCPAGRCKALITYYIDPEACTGCTICAPRCPAGVISGEKKQPHVIDASGCTKCDTCRQICPVDAVKVRSGVRQPAAAT